jgi:hypothetical protein
MTIMQKIYRRIALVLAFLIFCTSTGFSIDMHFCQDQLKSISFIGKAKSCHDLSANATIKKCPHHQKMMKQDEGCSTDGKNCCSNKTFYFQANKDQQFQSAVVIENKQLEKFDITSVPSFQFDKFGIVSDSAPYSHYKPPLILKDIPVLIQSFLL